MIGGVTRHMLPYLSGVPPPPCRQALTILFIILLYIKCLDDQVIILYYIITSYSKVCIRCCLFRRSVPSSVHCFYHNTIFLSQQSQIKNNKIVLNYRELDGHVWMLGI